MLMDTSAQQAEPDFFKMDAQSDQETDLPAPAVGSVSWSASEFTHHQKSAQWYLIAVASIALLSFLSYLVTSDAIGPISVVILGVLLLVVANRKPRTVEYTIDAHGIVVGSREYLYDDFQSFSVVQEDQIECISLFPQKRFAPEIDMYFSPDDGQKIFDILSDSLPFEQRDRDRIDKFLHKIRF